MQDPSVPASPASPRTYLIVAAHPDDADFGVAGTAAGLARAGHQVHYLVCSSGDAGSEDASLDPQALARLREQEQDAAARLLGLAGTHYLRLRDGELEPSLALRRAIVRVIRQVRADVVLCQDPRMLVDDDSHYLNHPDHRAAGQAAVDAAFPGAGNPSAYRDLTAAGFPPHKVREVWLYFTNAAHANHWTDITDTLELKLRALACHASQIGDWVASGGMRQEITRWAEEEARQHGLPYRYAEGFQRVVIVSDEPPRPPEAEALEAQTED